MDIGIIRSSSHLYIYIIFYDFNCQQSEALALNLHNTEENKQGIVEVNYDQN